MAFTFSKLASVTVGAGGSTTISFANIPQNYKDLCIKISGRDSVTGVNNLLLSINGASVGSWRWLRGDGGSVVFGNNTTTAGFLGYLPTSSDTASTFGNTEIYIPNYTSSNYKSISGDSVHEHNGATAYQTLTANLFTQTSPVTTLTFTVNTAFVQYSTATLYGIRSEV